MIELKKQLAELIQQSNYPAEAVYFVVKDLYRDLEEIVKSMATQEKESEEKEEEKKDDN